MSDESASPAPSQWYCDRCSELISDPIQSLVVWKSDDEYRDGGFLLVHKGKCDPGSTDGGEAYPLSAEIDAFLGEDGQAALLSKISVGPIINGRGSTSRRVQDLDEFVHLFRRLQTPYYEEARRHFRCPGVLDRLYDANEFYPYEPSTLRRIAQHEGECVFA